jgi:hypothetical protein
MRVEKFDPQERDALHKLGFEIAADGEVACIDDGDFRIEIIRPHGSKNFDIGISLPDGGVLSCSTNRAALMQAAGIEEDEDETEPST